MNKVIAIMMMMSITFAMPAMAGNKTNNHGKNDKAVVVNNDKKASHFDKVENMKGVMDTNWNPRTRELTVRYDANKTSARNIKHFVA